jgi:hypothetical protein
MRAAYEPLATRPTKAGVKESRKIAECLPSANAVKRIETVILLDYEGTQCPSSLFDFRLTWVGVFIAFDLSIYAAGSHRLLNSFNQDQQHCCSLLLKGPCILPFYKTDP